MGGPTKAGTSSPSSSEAAAHLRQTPRPKGSGNLRSKRQKASGRSPRLSWDSRAILSNPPSRCLIHLPSRSTPHQPPPTKKPVPSEDSCCQEAVVISGLFSSPLTLSTAGLAWRGQMSGRSLGTEPKKRGSGLATEPCTHSATPSNKGDWREARSQAGKSSRKPEKQGL